MVGVVIGKSKDDVTCRGGVVLRVVVDDVTVVELATPTGQVMIPEVERV